jgi:adenylosuccinate lyase
MIARYSAPIANVCFSDQFKIRNWRHITDNYASASMEELGEKTMIGELSAYKTPTPEAVRTREAETGHDVVAFLSVYTQDMPDNLKRHIHRGLTSSDLVDWAHFYALRFHAAEMLRSIDDLRGAVAKFDMVETARIGRSHGQAAAPTTLSHQLRVYTDLLVDIANDLHKFQREPIMKSPGPTGKDVATLPRRAHAVSKLLGAEIVRSTQIIPRDYQIRWAALYLRLAGICENLAMLVRLGARSEVGELREGLSSSRVGSSTMPHKHNPIDSEKICGLARVVRGYFSTIAENNVFWEERDISNSSVERITVPDFAATMEHMMFTTVNVISNLQQTVNHERLCQSSTWTALAQTLVQEYAVLGPVEAGGVVREWKVAPESHVNTLRQVGYNWMKDNTDEDATKRWLLAFNQATYAIAGE